MIRFVRNSYNSIRIECSDNSHFDAIRETFSIPNPAAKFSLSAWTPSKFYSISPMGIFKAGMMRDVYSTAKTLFGKDQIELDSSIREIVAPSKTYLAAIPSEDDIRPISSSVQLRQEQKRAICAALKEGRAVVVSPTGSGKGMIIFGLIDTLSKLVPDFKYVLLMVPNVQLIHQLYDEGVKYGFDPSEMLKHFTKSRLGVHDIKGRVRVVITNRSFIQEPNNFSVFKNAEQPSVVMVDEVHTIKKSAKFSMLVDRLTTPFKFGFTGTVSPAKWDEYQMKGLVGPIVYEETIEKMQSIGTLSQIQIYQMIVKYSHADLRSFDWITKSKELKEKFKAGKTTKEEKVPQLHAEEFKLLYLDDWTQDQIKKLVISLGNKNTLILYDLTEIGMRIFSNLQEKLTDRSLHLINGTIPTEERLKIQKDFEASDRQIVVAQTQTFSTGINIRNIHNIIFAFSSKSSIKIVQSIGRGLRVLEGKSHLNLIDITSTLQYSTRHANERKEVYYESYGKSELDIKKIVLPYGTEQRITI